MARPKRDVYQEITDALLERMKQGDLPWHKPWSRIRDGHNGMPYNYVRNTGYRGLNICLLQAQADAHGWTDNRWCTYNQAQSKGWQVRKGERSSLVTFWKFPEVQDKRTGKTKTVPFLRYYSVFNFAQIDGVPEQEYYEPVEIEFACLEARELIEAAQPAIVHGGDQAMYRGDLDRIHMPRPEAFKNEDGYWRTLLHETTHWTGHPSRLGREMKGGFGSKTYAFEELVADMGAAFLCSQIGLDYTDMLEHHAAYLQNWMKKLKDDKRAFAKAAGLAQKAADFVLAFRDQPTEERDEIAGIERPVAPTEATVTEEVEVEERKPLRSIYDWR